MFIGEDPVTIVGQLAVGAMVLFVVAFIGGIAYGAIENWWEVRKHG